MIILSTFLETPDQVDLLHPFSPHAIIIDSPIFSVRSFTAHHWTIDELKTARSKLNPKAFILNIDGLYSDSELQIMRSNCSSEFTNLFTAIRIQDPGLFKWVKDLFPHAEIQLNSETGNQHLYSLDTLFNLGFSQITLSHEIPYQTIQSFLKKYQHLEIFVQGNILIQYSRRRFISDRYDSDSAIPISHLAEDPELPNRHFTFLNTSFGHFMFAHFHRCLAGYRDQLFRLSGCPWLIDARGQSNDYLQTSLELYSSLDSLSNNDISTLISSLEKQSEKPQKPSFFLSNNTDYDWRDYDTTYDKDNCVGRIISVTKPDTICLQFFTTISPNTTIICYNPDQSFIEINLDDIACFSNCGSIIPLTLYFIPWQKGIQTKAALYIKDS